MLTIEQLKANQAAELAELEAALALAAALPAPGATVLNARAARSEPFATYAAPDFTSALAIIECFEEKLPYVTVADGGIRYIDASERMPARRAGLPGAKESDGAPYLYLHNYGLSSGTEATFKFYVRALDRIVHIWVRVKRSPWHIRLVTARGHEKHDDHSRVVRRDYPQLDGAERCGMNVGPDGGGAYYFWLNEGDFYAFVRNELAPVEG